MDIFQALAEPSRRQILEIIAKNGELSASEIYDNFDTSAPAISQHLKILRDSNLVMVKKRAQQRIYKINPKTFLEMENWLEKIKKLWNVRFDALEKVLQEEKKKLL